MSVNGNGIKATFVEQEHERITGQSDEHLCIIISQETYDAVMEVVDRATARGLESSFDYWLGKCAESGAQAKIRTWDDRDVVSLMAQARKGNATAIAKLRKMFPNL